MSLFSWFNWQSPRRNPTLPQNAVIPGWRKTQLIGQQNTYQWTYEKNGITQIPLSATVPYRDQPTLKWLAEALKIAGKVYFNTWEIFGKISLDIPENERPSVVKDKLSSATQRVDRLLGRGEETDWSDDLYERTFENLNEIVSAIQDILKEPSSTQPFLTQGGTEGLAPYESIFRIIDLPKIASTFMEDETFARLRVAGSNPMLIARLEELPDDFSVSEAGFQKVMGSGDHLETALSEKRLFWLDYSSLKALSEHPATWKNSADQILPGEKANYDKRLVVPRALFAVPKGQGSLKPVAIQCGLSAEAPVIYAATDSSSADYWKWQTAKTYVQIADANYHELFVHLARTHLVMEAFTLATYRHFAQSHPLYILLVPHFEGTLFINDRATKTLINDTGPIAQSFVGQVEYSQKAAGADRLAFDFYGMMPPNDFAARGIDDAEILKDFPYRDDALLIWQTIRDWVQDYVGIYYEGDEDVEKDNELAEWVRSLQTKGKIKGFPDITTQNQLIDVLAMVIFTGSAQHAAVNFSQASLMSYAPACSEAIWGGDIDTTTSREDWLKVMPPMAIAATQLSMTYLLGSVYYRKLGEYQTNDFPYPSWFQDPKITRRGGSLDSFKAALEMAETEITKRNNSKERKEPYTFLLPSNIPPSINI